MSSPPCPSAIEGDHMVYTLTSQAVSIQFSLSMLLAGWPLATFPPAKRQKKSILLQVVAAGGNADNKRPYDCIKTWSNSSLTNTNKTTSGSAEKQSRYIETIEGCSSCYSFCRYCFPSSKTGLLSFTELHICVGTWSGKLISVVRTKDGLLIKCSPVSRPCLCATPRN